jgi:hypothetical protein
MNKLTCTEANLVGSSIDHAGGGVKDGNWGLLTLGITVYEGRVNTPEPARGKRFRDGTVQAKMSSAIQ